jgi:putative transcriptional regulator
MSIAHHLDDATLMGLAAGTLTPALAIVAASHVAWCPQCRQGLAAAEAVGGALLKDLAPVPIERAPPALPAEEPEWARPQSAARSSGAASSNELPPPLARLVGGSLDAIRWRPLALGIWHYRIALDGKDSGELRLIKASRGYGLPAHGHNGAELTLVLRGAFHDEIGRFNVGDAADLDESIEHRPVADPDTGCICALACERPARFHGLLPRLLQPLFGL